MTELQAIIDKISALEKERDRFKAEADGAWKLRNESYSLQGKVSELEKKLAKSLERQEQLFRDNQFWRRAVRYEQHIKNNKGRVKHLPVFNGVHRSKSRWDGWTNREREFLKHWRQENRRTPGTNGGRGVLELILSENSNEHAADITQRDATVAATVVTWLGTHCGQAFLWEVQRHIDAKKKARGAA